MTSKPILLVGEAFGQSEASLGVGFVGASGALLLRMLAEAEVITFAPADHNLIAAYYRRNDPKQLDAIWRRHADTVRRTNVFNLHPPGNKLDFFCGGKADGLPGYGPLLPSRYVRSEFATELTRLGDEVLALDPNLIICLGNTAVWAFTGRTGVGKLRGTTCLSTHCVADYKLLVAYHPAAVMRQWEQRPTTIVDLSKAPRENAIGTLARPAVEIWIEPDLDDIKTFFAQNIKPGHTVSVDIETSGTRITCIGFGPRSDLAIVIPFDDSRKPGRSYWPDAEHERLVWELIREVLEDATVPKVMQNGLYDVAFLLRSYGIRTFGATHDTMLLSHSLQPEMLKGLGFLGSLYTDHGAWKSQRKVGSTIKRDA